MNEKTLLEEAQEAFRHFCEATPYGPAYESQALFIKGFRAGNNIGVKKAAQTAIEKGKSVKGGYNNAAAEIASAILALKMPEKNIKPIEIKYFKDGYGLIHSDMARTSSNCIRYTSEATLFDLVPIPDFEKALGFCQMKEKPAGWSILKGPGNFSDQVTIDDVLPLISVQRGIYEHSDMAEQLLNRKFVVRNSTQLPSPKSWLWRHLPLISACYREAFFLKPLCYALMPITWAVIATTGFFNRKAQDGYILSFHLRHCLPECPPLKWAYNLMRRRMLRVYPGGYEDLLTHYYGFAHPIATAWSDFG